MVCTSSVAPSLNSVVLVLLCVHVCISCGSGSVVQWNLSEMVTELGSHLSKQPASLAPNDIKALQSTSVQQLPLYKGQLELTLRWLF